MNSIKKLLFLTRYRLDRPFTLKFKFDSQMLAFQHLGYEVWNIAYDQDAFYLIHGQTKLFLRKAHTSLPQYEHLFFYMEFGLAIAKAALISSAFSLAYFRETPGFGMLHYGLKKLSRLTPIICEIPTYNKNGTTGEKQHGLRGLFDRYGAFWKRRDAACFRLYALIGAENPSGSFRGRPSVNIRNGINLEALPLRKPLHDNLVHVLALGSMGPWHGFDRAIKAAGAYRGSIPFRLHIVGTNDGGCLEQWTQLAHSLKLGERVVFEGPAYDDKLHAFFDLCDIGLSSLAPYRNGAERLYSLKLREYMARGLPVVYAADDPAIETDPSAKDFTLAVDNSSSTPDWEKILNFALATKSRPCLPEEIRSFAKIHFTWESQLAPVLQLVEQD